MEPILTILILEGLILTRIRMTQIELLQKWIRGELTYNQLKVCKKRKLLHVRRLNPGVTIGKHPGFLKKDD